MKRKEVTSQQQLENLQQEFDEFAYIVSHDLKAPLRAICNLSAWIKEDLGTDLDPDIQHNMDLLQNRTERMERMINGLLLYSRITRFDLEIKEVKVGALVQDLAAGLQGHYPFTLHASTLPTLTTYAQKLETVLYHLLQNAVKFNESPSPQVWVEALPLDNAIQFTIRDNGIGIAADAQEKVYKMFYTVQPKDQQESLGVGLTITKKIIQYVGGSISLSSEKGVGTEVKVIWPWPG